MWTDLIRCMYEENHQRVPQTSSPPTRRIHLRMCKRKRRSKTSHKTNIYSPPAASAGSQRLACSRTSNWNECEGSKLIARLHVAGSRPTVAGKNSLFGVLVMIISTKTCLLMRRENLHCSRVHF